MVQRAVSRDSIGPCCVQRNNRKIRTGQNICKWLPTISFVRPRKIIPVGQTKGGGVSDDGGPRGDNESADTRGNVKDDVNLLLGWHVERRRVC